MAPTVPAQPPNEQTPASHQAEIVQPDIPRQVESAAATGVAEQPVDEAAETRKRNRELALAERRAKREELQLIWFEDWKRHVWDPEFIYNLDGTERDAFDGKTFIEDKTWFDLP